MLSSCWLLCPCLWRIGPQPSNKPLSLTSAWPSPLCWYWLSFSYLEIRKLKHRQCSVSQFTRRAELMLQSGFPVKFTSHSVACVRPQLSKKPGLGEAGGWLRMENWKETNFSCQSEEQAGEGLQSRSSSYAQEKE